MISNVFWVRLWSLSSKLKVRHNRLCLGKFLKLILENSNKLEDILQFFSYFRYVNGIVIYPQIDSNYMVISKAPGVYELRINSIDYIHEGTITCKARNLYEEIEESWRIHIDGKGSGI